MTSTHFTRQHFPLYDMQWRTCVVSKLRYVVILSGEGKGARVPEAGNLSQSGLALDSPEKIFAYIRNHSDMLSSPK